MKKIYFLFFFILIGFGLLKAQNIYIPDANFKQYLVTNFDTSGDGEIQQIEALNVTSIDCYVRMITSLEGIKSFINLQSLNCANNAIVNIDLQGMSNIKSLFLSGNPISSLNIQGLNNLQSLSCAKTNLNNLVNLSNFTNLTYLDCSLNNFTSLNLEGLVNLKTLKCSYNKLMSLDVSLLSNLQILDGSHNKLSSINLNGLVKLSRFECSYNEISNINIKDLNILDYIDLSNNKLTLITLQNLPSLSYLQCSYNDLSILDLSGLSMLNKLECVDNRNLATLILKNGRQQYHLNIANTNLKYICCDDSEYDYIQSVINQAGLQNQCSLNSYCSLTPGGKYNTIQGTTKYNIDNNGCSTSNLFLFPIKYSISDGNSPGIIVGNTNGNYKTYVNAGTFTITPIFENPDYFISSPLNHQYTFAENNNNTETQNFCISPNGTKNDLEVKIIPITSVRPGFNVTFQLIYKNKGNTVLNGDLNFSYDKTKSQYISSDISPNSQTAGNLTWNYSDLKPFESRTINIILKTNAPPTVNVNDELVYSSTINPVSGDLTMEDNTFSLHQNVVGSFDPNDKVCLEGNKLSSELIGKYVTYKIRFENTGTANAEQVVVKDNINTSMFDVKSIIPITASHQYQTRIAGNVVEFIFENIDLAFDDEHNDGYIVFKIKSLPTLEVGSILKNKADIFFDYNLPIMTNEYQSDFQTLSTSNLNLKIKTSIYPNPAKDFLYIDTKEKIKSVEIYDISGRILQKFISSEKKIDINNLKKGIYMIKMITEKGSAVQKFIKD